MRRTITVVLLAGAAFSATGCARSMMEPSVVTDYEPLDAGSELDYWSAVQRRSAITNDEGFHGVILLADGQDATGGYEARVELLKERGWVKPGFDEPAAMAMRRGTLAKAIAHAIELDGGVMMSLTGKAPRYANRELVYVGIMPDGTANQVLGGPEFVGVMSRSQDFVLLRQAAFDAAAAKKAQAEGVDAPPTSDRPPESDEPSR